MDTFATTVSVALQYGVPLRDLVNKFAHVRFEPSGFTGNQEIPIAKSIVDYIFRWLGSRFLSPDDKADLGLIDRSAMLRGARVRRFGGVRLRGRAAPPARRRRSRRWLEPPTADAASPMTRPVDDAPEAGAGRRDLRRGRGDQPSRLRARSRAVPRCAARDELAVVARTARQRPARRHREWPTAPAPSRCRSAATNVAFKIQEDAPSCAECGSIMVRNGSCYKCLNCGSTSGCS